MGSSIYLPSMLGPEETLVHSNNPEMGESACVSLICAGSLGTNLELSLSQTLFPGKPVKTASGVTLKGKEEGDPEVSKVLLKLTSMSLGFA